MRRALVLVLTACAAPQHPLPTPTPSPLPAATPPAPTASASEAPPPAPPADRFATRVIGGAGDSTSRARYTGTRIDLDLKSADIRDVCRLLADVGKVNIVVSDDVQGSVTVKMKSVPWDQALDVILQSKGFSAERDGRMILVTRGAPR